MGERLRCMRIVVVVILLVEKRLVVFLFCEPFNKVPAGLRSDQKCSQLIGSYVEPHPPT